MERLSKFYARQSKPDKFFFFSSIILVFSITVGYSLYGNIFLDGTSGKLFDRLYALYEFIYPSSLPHAIQMHGSFTVHFIPILSICVALLITAAVNLRDITELKYSQVLIGGYVILAAMAHYLTWWVWGTDCTQGSCYEGEEIVFLWLIFPPALLLLTLVAGLLRFGLRRMGSKSTVVDVVKKNLFVFTLWYWLLNGLFVLVSFIL